MIVLAPIRCKEARTVSGRRIALRRTRRQRCMRLEDLIFLLVLDEIGCNSAHLVVGEFDRCCNSTRLVVDE